MCGIFGIISNSKINKNDLKILAMNARQRGKDSSGFLEYIGKKYHIKRYDYDVKKSINYANSGNKILIGHSRLVTNSMPDNQPVLKNDVIIFHNGIITNHTDLYKKFSFKRDYNIDTEIIADLINYFLKKSKSLDSVINSTLSNIKGIASCAIFLQKKGKIILFSNNGSMYYGKKGDDYYISSEIFSLRKIKCNEIKQVDKATVFDVPSSNDKISTHDDKIYRKNLVPKISKNLSDEKLLIYKFYDVKRCSKCILPINFPFIDFDKNDICNFCNNYQKKYENFNDTYKKNFLNLLEKYKSKNIINCIFPLSGGRDSCYGLHIATKELGLKPITFTYDWGLVTDLARRNISRMCSTLNVENIIVADNIQKKRSNIKKNVSAWLKKPHLGMVNLFTAGDKHFYRYLDRVKYQNQISLNIWSYNPYEITHFKHGFLNIKPDFNNKKTYNSGLKKQLDYQMKRLKVMFTNFSYLNSSIIDTLIGEYSRSIRKHTDYYYLFNYFKWDETKINDTLLNTYEWELSPDSSSTWRIGDGAAPFYNYIYHTLAGFTEFDTFRSNQIREGVITREEAMQLIKKENKPRYQSIKWFLEILDLNFKDVIERINTFSIHKR